MTIPESGLINPAQCKAVREAIERAACDPSFLSAILGAGPVEQFEEAFAWATGGKYALALSSCTAALHIALMALGIGPEDEVIVSSYTWGQSVAPVLFTGATAVFADIDPKTLTIDPNSVETRVSNRTRAIIPVHLFGNPADMDALCSIAAKHGLYVISDAAHAFGALSKGRMIGGLGDVACFSLGIGKGVCGGEGGVLVTNNQTLYERAIAISQHPLRAFREIVTGHDSICSDELSWNYRIHPFAAVLALADLQVAEQRIACRKRFLQDVHQHLRGIRGVAPISCYPRDSSAAYGIPLTHDSQEVGGIPRESLVEALQSEGIPIQAGPVRAPIHLRPTFQQYSGGWFRVVPHCSHKKGSCPVAEFRCESQEMLFLRATMMDKTSVGSAARMVRQIKDTIVRDHFQSCRTPIS